MHLVAEADWAVDRFSDQRLIVQHKSDRSGGSVDPGLDVRRGLLVRLQHQGCGRPQDIALDCLPLRGGQLKRAMSQRMVEAIEGLALESL